MLGSGISRNIRNLYSWLSKHHQDGDEVFLIGFSRGACTVRSLAGMIAVAGLIAPEDRGECVQHNENFWYHAGERRGVCDAYPAYRRRDTGWRARPEWSRAKQHLPIRFVGVFDTVGALGIPFGTIERARNYFWPAFSNNFHNTRLGPDVVTARQALAVDERRGSFKPTLWTPKGRPE